jgi:chromosomal replication initiation ATPase DnaA
MHAYRKYLLDHTEMENPLKNIYKGFVLGSDDFIAGIEQKIAKYGVKREIPETKSPQSKSADEVVEALVRSLAITRKEIFEKRRGNTINHLALHLMKEKTDLSLKAIGRLFNMDYAAVSIAAKRFKEKLRWDTNARLLLERALKALEKC